MDDNSFKKAPALTADDIQPGALLLQPGIGLVVVEHVTRAPGNTVGGTFSYYVPTYKGPNTGGSTIEFAVQWWRKAFPSSRI